jgi:hypothetical protein
MYLKVPLVSLWGARISFDSDFNLLFGVMILYLVNLYLFPYKAIKL